MKSIAEAADALAGVSKTTIALSGGTLTADQALGFAARAAVANAENARTRTGIWASESTKEQIEEVLFFASVARDALDGTTSRPSTGNVREYVLNKISA